MATSKKKDYSDPQTHSLSGSLSSLVCVWGGGAGILSQLLGVEGHFIGSHEMVMPNLGWTGEICLILLTKGQVFLVLRAESLAVFEFLYPEKYW